MRKKTKSKPIIKRTVRKPKKPTKQVKRKSVKKLPPKKQTRKPVKKQTKSNIRKRSVVIVRGDKKDKRDKPLKKSSKKILAKVTSRINKKTKSEEKELEKKRRDKVKKKIKKEVKLAKEKAKLKEKEKAKQTSKKKRKKVKKSPFQNIINLTKKRKLNWRQKLTLKKYRKNLTNQRYRWRKKLAKAKTKSARLKINKRILQISVAIRAINVKLGVAKKVKKVPEKKFEKEKVGKKVIQKSIIVVWEGRDKLNDAIKGGFFKEFIIRGKKFKKNQIADIYVAFSDLEDYAYSFGINTPYIVVYERITDKIIEFDIYD